MSIGNAAWVGERGRDGLGVRPLSTRTSRADMVLGQADIAVVVTDRLSNLLYVNEFAAGLFRVSGDVARLAGCPVLSLGLFADDDVRKTEDLAGQVLRGRSWEGTFESVRGDGSRVLIRALAVPLRHPGGDIDGMVILAREASRRDKQGEQDRIALLERVGERLAGSLEIGTTLKHVAEILVPQFADHCFIDLFQGEALVRRAQRHASDWVPPPGTWAQVGEQIHYPDGHFCQQAMARLDTIAVNDLDSEYYPAPSPESMAAAHQAGLTSVIAAPLYARGELLGVMSLALSRLTERDEHHYDTPDRDLIGAIASRVAIAIDNAMLFETERQTALAFQKSLLPQAIPELDGLEVACRYVPAKPLETQGQGIQTQVGGDWYDIIPLAAGRVGIVIGDVEGRGARAAAIMGQLRAALRAFAQDEKSPADIMRKLDEWCRALAPVDENGMTAGDPPTVSCIYMIYDAWSRELTFANAGHDAPLMISAGQVRQLEFMYKGVLLGVRGKGIQGLPTYKEQTIGMPPGAILVFFTDGLTDRRTRADGSGHYSEAEAVPDAAAGGPRGRGQRGCRRGGHGGRVRGARRHRRRHGHLGGEVLAVRARLDRALVPGRADHGLRGQAACRADVPVLGHGARAGRTRVPAGLRGGHQRRPARLGHAEPGPRAGFGHGAADDARAGRRVRPGRPPCRCAQDRRRSGPPAPVRTGAPRRPGTTASPDAAPALVPNSARTPDVRPVFPQGVRAAAAARRDLGVGGSIRPRPPAAPDPHRGGDRRRRPRPLPGRAAGYPVGIQADPGGQGGLVRDAAQRQRQPASVAAAACETQSKSPPRRR